MVVSWKHWLYECNPNGKQRNLDVTHRNMMVSKHAKCLVLSTLFLASLLFHDVDTHLLCSWFKIFCTKIAQRNAKVFFLRLYRLLIQARTMLCKSAYKGRMQMRSRILQTDWTRSTPPRYCTKISDALKFELALSITRYRVTLRWDAGYCSRALMSTKCGRASAIMVHRIARQ